METNENNVFNENQLIEDQPEEVESQEVEQVEASPEENPVQEEKQDQPKQSWKELRDKAERADKAEKERDEALRILKAIEQEAMRYQQQAPPVETQEEEADYNLGDDELVEGKHLKKMLSKEQKRLKQLEENLLRQQRYSQENAIHAQLKSKYDDFDQVLTAENIAALRDTKPSLAKSLALNPDLYEKAVDTYSLIKDLGIYRPDLYSKEKEIAQRNASKPRSLNSIAPQQGDSPLSQANAFANGLTPELKKKLYAEMLEKAKSR